LNPLNWGKGKVKDCYFYDAITIYFLFVI
jgi:hypothetical protein